MVNSFRQYIPKRGHPRLGPVDFSKQDAESWTRFGLKNDLIRRLWSDWQKLYGEPYKGITVNGKIEPGLFHLRDEDAPVSTMVEKATDLVAVADKYNLSQRLRFPIDADEWRCWQNPEFRFHNTGIRFEEQPEEVRYACLKLIEVSLSTRGYEDVLAAMHTNEFLGNLVHAPKIMNQDSYNFILFGTPLLTEPWGWSIWGHHLTFCVFMLKSQIVMSPVFRGCEPNVIDQGPHVGTEMFVEEMRLATRMMETLTDAERKSVVLYDQLDHPDMPEGFPHPADGRNLAGAYEDNRVIPYAGGRVIKFSQRAQHAVLELVESLIDFLPPGSLAAKMADVRQYLDETWLLWMGGYGKEDVFHFRILSPVILCEFDHECGMWLTNSEPGRFHVHSVVRTPNGNDYGKSLLQLWREHNCDN